MKSWIKNRPDLYGKNGIHYRLYLDFRQNNYYGHGDEKTTELVEAVWDSICECFWEINTKKEICIDDITKLEELK